MKINIIFSNYSFTAGADVGSKIVLEQNGCEVNDDGPLLFLARNNTNLMILSAFELFADKNAIIQNDLQYNTNDISTYL